MGKNVVALKDTHGTVMKPGRKTRNFFWMDRKEILGESYPVNCVKGRKQRLVRSPWTVNTAQGRRRRWAN